MLTDVSLHFRYVEVSGPKLADVLFSIQGLCPTEHRMPEMIYSVNKRSSLNCEAKDHWLLRGRLQKRMHYIVIQFTVLDE